jgi:hypothetical protein
MTDTEYQKKRKLMKESSEEQEVAKEVQKVVKSSEFDSAMEKAWAKMSDQEKEGIAKALKQQGIIGELEEDLGGDGVDFSKAVSLGMNLVENINEAGIVRTPADDTIEAIKKKVGKGLARFGQINVITMGVPAALLTAALGGSAMLAGPAVAAGMAIGGILWWLGDKISGEETTIG